MMHRMLMIAASLACAAPLGAQTSPYAHEAPRSIKALADDEVASLLDGAGMGFARAAELNGVPGPRHALDLADSLHLDDAQRIALRDVFAQMQARARGLGSEIVQHERELDASFAAGTITAEDVQRRSVELGRLYGELRAVHLAAHLETATVLNAHQIARYAVLRGYAGETPGGTDHGAHH